MKEKVRIFLPEQKVNARIEEIAQKISSDYAGQEVHLICILKEVYFSPVGELAERITVPVTLDFMSVSQLRCMVRSPAVSSGSSRIWMSRSRARYVLVVEDIIDSGRTLSHLLEDSRADADPQSSADLCTPAGQAGAPRGGGCRRSITACVHRSGRVCGRLRSGLCAEIPQPAVCRDCRV